MEPILYQLSKAVLSAIDGTDTQRKFIPHVLRDLTRLETRPWCLTVVAYEWCSVMCRNHGSLRDWESLLLVSLEIGFRHLDVRNPYIGTRLTHTEHHRELVGIVFKSKKSEVIADLLNAWTIGYSLDPVNTSLGICAEHLVSLHNLVPFSSRLRRLVIRSIELVGYKGFEEAGVERFIGLLNYLHVAVDDMDREHVWARLLLATLKSFEGTRYLSYRYWELLVELAILESLRLAGEAAYCPRIMTSLVEAQEWKKLECWMGTVWILWPPGAGGMTEEEFHHSMLLLFRQRPGATQRLEQWMERWSQECDVDIPESFQRIYKQVHEVIQQGLP